jgi:predicted DNA-binding WGR domain protein
MVVKITVMKKAEPAFLILRKVDPSRNMARFYVVSVQPTLFGGGSLVRNWGRIGSRGRAMIELFDDFADADSAMSRLANTKRSRGYVREAPAAPAVTAVRRRGTKAVGSEL